MASVPRIVVVDNTPDVAHIVRGALAMLSRQYILVEVPTCVDAIDEILQSKTQLVVTAYDLPGEMNGIDLARRINHESLVTPVIVMADAGDPDFDGQLKNAPFQYFVRPVAEAFLRGLRVALDGEAALAESSYESPVADTLGPVPQIDVGQIRKTVVSLMRDVGAMGVIMADRTGRVLIDEGATGYVDRDRLAVILGPSFARAGEISPMIGGNAWTMHYYDGERMDVFGLALGLHYFLGLIFEGTSNRGALGAVTMFGRRAADLIIEMLGDAAYATREVQPLPVIETPDPVAEIITDEQVDVRSHVEVEVRTQPARMERPTLEPVLDFDADRLFSQHFDEGAMDDLFDPDRLGDLAESLANEDDERVGYDEAIDMGILDD